MQKRQAKKVKEVWVHPVAGYAYQLRTIIRKDCFMCCKETNHDRYAHESFNEMIERCVECNTVWD